ncbi:ANTAR domain-containing response regulator [Humisphaera borealis]|uniref:ANTAR domain-containing protein n=1 Tax=Humisphaera borealis TaxID=2807512 RepID=A0A7M2WSN7_9BACT|nr:ANTAR domain-containing protein [Humisphaera borealis]QOV87821.1 ANTAR domain-containing protein [Humisphaera borealis]
MPLRVLLVADDAAVVAPFQSAIRLAGHVAVASAAVNAEEALGHVSAFEANAVLMVVPFHGDDGFDLCRALQLSGPIPVVVVTDQADPRLISQCLITGVVGCIGRSATVGEIAATLSLGGTWFAAVARLRAERDSLVEQSRQLLQTLENRKLIERAKGIYMKLLGLQEAEAHRRLQQESQKRRLGLAELARKIIESDELLGRG